MKISMRQNEDKRVQFKRAAFSSTADVSQIHLGQASYPSHANTDNEPRSSSHTPIFPPIRPASVSNRPRPLPEFNYDDFSIHDPSVKPDPSKFSYFLDGKKRVDFVLVYREPHDEYMVTASPAKEAALQRQFYVDQLRKADLALEYYRHQEHNGNVLVFIKIHVPWAVLCREAERLRMRMPLVIEDPDEEEDGETKRSWWHFFTSRSKYIGESNGDDDGADDPPSFGGRRLTWTFDRQHLHMFKIDHPETFFKWRHRTEIVKNILQECRNDQKHDRRHGIDPMLERGLFDDAFPLHDGAYGSMHPYTHGSKAHLSARQRLHVEWAGWTSSLKPQPLNRIRNYFGEKFGFYFAFMDFYTKMLIFPSAFGVLAFVYGLISTGTAHKEAVDHICSFKPGETGALFMCPICNPPNCAPVYMAHDCELSRWQFRLDNEATVMVSCATLVWCALFVKFWKRREAQLAVDWDTYEAREDTDHRPNVAIRATYEERAAATKRSNPVTMEPESYVPRHKRVVRVAASIAVATLLLIAAGGSLMGLIVSRIALYGAYRKLGEPFSSGNVEWSRWTVHGFIFCMVVIFEWIYDNIADRLTELECPKTTEQFLSSLLWKLFIFEELVDLLPIAYAAWFRGKGVTPKDLTFHSEICEPNGCMSEVVELVAVLLLARLVIGNIAEIAYPAMKTFAKATFRTFFSWWSSKRKGRLRDRSRHWPQWLKDYHLNELKLDGVAEEFMEMMIQFSFVAFFVPAFPLIPLVCLLNNVAEIRVDAINFLASHRRPEPMRVPGIQIWNKFMEIILIVAVLCNAALIAFTSEIVPRLFHKYVASTSNVTVLDYKAFSLSKMAVTDWDQLREYLKAHPIAELGAHPRDVHADHESPSSILQNVTMDADTQFNDTHTHCYYLDFRHGKPPYGYSPTWWKIFCLRVATFTTFLIIFYIFLFLCDSAISDIPSDVTKRLKRREYLVRSKWTTKKRQRDDEYAVAQYSQNRWLKAMRRATIFSTRSAFKNETTKNDYRNAATVLATAASSIL